MQFFILILVLAILLALAGSIPKLLLILLTFPAAIIGKLYDKWYEKNDSTVPRRRSSSSKP